MAPTTFDASFDTPNIPASTAVFVAHGTARIAAPASLVFRTLRNTETWKDWNKWIPKINITFQPPDGDLATAAEITELVRNTSIAGSIDSDLADGLVTANGAPRKLSTFDGGPTPPLKLRRQSEVSKASGRTGSDASESAGLSGAQKYAMATEARRASIASGNDPGPVKNNFAPDSTNSPASEKGARRKSNVQAALSANIAKAKAASLMQLYGEPSVRLQLNSKMTFGVRMNPNNPNEYKPLHMIVTEVSRPDDPTFESANLTALTRSKTHTLSRQPIYRIVWTIDSSQASLSSVKNGSSFPKSLLQAERVHEIRPIYLGDGSEECEYRTWECQRGPLSKMAKKKYGDYIQKQYEQWGKNLGDFCETLGGKVDRRDFILEQDAEEVY